MGFKIKLNNINVPSGNEFKVFYKLNSRTPGNVAYQSDLNWGTLYGSYVGGVNTDIEIDFTTIDPNPYGKQNWFKILDLTTGSYIIENIYIHQYQYYKDCNECCVYEGGNAIYIPNPTPTPTPTNTPVPTPTPTPSSTPTPTPSSTPTPTPTSTPTPTPSSTPTPTPTPTVPPVEYKIRRFFGGNSIQQTTCNGENFYPSWYAYTYQLTEPDGVTPKINTTGGDVVINAVLETVGCGGSTNRQLMPIIIPNGQSESGTYDTTNVTDCSGVCTETTDTYVCYSSITPSGIEPADGSFLPICVPAEDCRSYTVTQVSAPSGNSIYIYISCIGVTVADFLNGTIGDSVTFCAQEGTVSLSGSGMQIVDNGLCS
jgi:hypothetical protein